jgi:hypothetical protein
VPRLSKKTIAAVQKYGPSVDDIAKQYGVSGAALLAKLVEGESHDDPDAVSSAGARGRTQFMPESRATVLQKYGVDPWSRDPDQAVHAAALHLRGLVNGSKGLTGYNPGDPSYPGYILGQNVGDVAHYGHQPSGSHPSGPRPAQTVRTVTPGVDNSPLRRQLVGQFLQQGGVGNPQAVLALATQYGQAQDTPATTTTRKLKTPKAPKTASTPAASKASGSKVLELIYNDGGKGYGIKDGKAVDGPSTYSAVWAGHANHVHVAAGPKTVVRLGRLAQEMGLSVGENPHFGGVDPVHVPGSYHYKAEAIDVSGDPSLMARFAKRVERYNRTRKL